MQANIFGIVFFFQMSNPRHKLAYKYANLDATELRRRREEEGIQIRKAKREQQLIKRRNVNLQDEEAVQVIFFNSHKLRASKKS